MLNKRMGATKKKVLLLLGAGIGLGLTHRSDKQWQIVRAVAKEWKDIDRRSLNRTVRSLYESHLVKERKYKDGTTSMVLTHEGEKMVLRYNLHTLELSKKKISSQKSPVMFLSGIFTQSKFLIPLSLIQGSIRVPPQLDVPKWHFKPLNSCRVSVNRKSAGKRSL